MWNRRWSATAVALIGFLAVQSPAQVGNFRITEVDPDADLVEVTNTGGAHTTPAIHPFCHEFIYTSVIPSSTSFLAGEIKTFPVSFLNDGDSDLWLYSQSPFFIAANLVHGVKYGPAPNVGRTGLASTVGLWPSATAFAPAPPAGTTLAYDGFGFTPFDWYIDETPTMGSADTSPFGVVPSSLEFPGGTQDFEGMSLGDEIESIVDWVKVDTAAAGLFTIRSVNDVQGVLGPRGSSTRWIRIQDDDLVGQNRFYSPSITTPLTRNYTWTFWINLERTPPASPAVAPRLTIQHDFTNSWGIEFTDTGANLVVTGNGGTPASTPIYSLVSPTGVGDWVKLELSVDFDANTVSASVNDVFAGSLPIALAANPSNYRFCYRGEGAGNVNTMLIDDITLDGCQQVTLDGSPTTLMAGDTLTLSCCGALPGSLGLLYIIDVSGVPFFLKVFNIPFDGNGEFELPVVIPNDPQLPGLDITLRKFAPDRNGKTAASNDLVLSFL